MKNRARAKAATAGILMILPWILAGCSGAAGGAEVSFSLPWPDAADPDPRPDARGDIEVDPMTDPISRFDESVPPVDRAAPALTETATFALG